MNNYFKKKIKELLKKAQEEFDVEDYINALLTFNQVLAIDEKNYEAYFGMYQSWYAYCYSIKEDSPMINDLFRSAYRVAPNKLKDDYLLAFEQDRKALKNIIDEK